MLDLSRLLPGGFCSLLLADFGADVLKVEDTGMGDYIRWSPPFYEGAHESARSALFLSLNRNKRSIRLDLKSERGREALLRLVREYDVVLESFRPGVLDRLGVGYERMREENPGIVYCAITGYGQDGPKRDASGHDMNYLGLIGLLGLDGRARRAARPGGGPDRRPRRRRADGGVRDPGRAARARWGAGARARARATASSSTCRCPTAPCRGLRWSPLPTSPTAPSRGEASCPWRAPLVCYRPYECADGWVSLGALEPKFWQAFCRGVGREELVGAQFERTRLGCARGGRGDLQGTRPAPSGRRSRASTTAAWSRCSSSTRRSPPSSSQRARWSWRSISRVRRAAIRQLGLPVKLERTPGEHARLPGPALGEHTEEVLSAAGYTQEQVAELLRCGAAAGSAQPRQDVKIRV